MDGRNESPVTMPSRKRRADDGDLDITPMIDITFLLLAFFVVVSKMDPSTQVAMPTAKHGATVPEQAAVIVIVTASDRDEPVVYLGRAKTDSAKVSGSIEDIEQQIGDYVLN
jgi:biopolymer transport protein TolR